MGWIVAAHIFVTLTLMHRIWKLSPKLYYVLLPVAILGPFRYNIGRWLEQEPLLWLLEYLQNDTRLYIMGYWLAWLVVAITTTLVWNVGDDPNGLNYRRKFFHFLIVAMFLPPLCFDVSIRIEK